MARFRLRLPSPYDDVGFYDLLISIFIPMLLLRTDRTFRVFPAQLSAVFRSSYPGAVLFPVTRYSVLVIVPPRALDEGPFPSTSSLAPPLSSLSVFLAYFVNEGFLLPFGCFACFLLVFSPAFRLFRSGYPRPFTAPDQEFSSLAREIRLFVRLAVCPPDSFILLDQSVGINL